MPCGQADEGSTGALASGSLEAIGASILAASPLDDDGATDFGRSVDGVFELHATNKNAANDFFTTK